jgi:hypothetical protein
MLDLMDVMGTAIAVDWDSLSLLFSVVQCLRFMRLGLITPFAIPDGGVLSSNSLNVLDIFIADDEFAVDLMLTMEVPGLTDLTLWARYALGVILRCTRILGQLTWLALQGNIFRGMSFFELFDSMLLLEVLDLRRSKCHVLQTYFMRTLTAAARSGRTSRLRAISMASMNLPSLEEFVHYHGANESSSGSHVTLRSVQMDHRVRKWDLKEYNWIGDHVTDFGASIYHHYPVSLISGPTAHSLFECC